MVTGGSPSERGKPTQKLSPDVPDCPPRIPTTERLCEMHHWRIECINMEPRKRWVCELICQGGYRHDIFIGGTFRRCLSHARRLERCMHELDLMAEAPLPVLNMETRIMSWPDGRADVLPPAVMQSSKSPRAHLRLIN